MSRKISELLNFEKIKDVIDIDALSDKKNMVEKYVITPTMEDHLVSLLQNINDSTHKAAQIVGGYGSGKSHLLAFIISILADIIQLNVDPSLGNHQDITQIEGVVVEMADDDIIQVNPFRL